MAMVARGATLPPPDAHVWLDLLDQRQQARAAWRRLFDEVDLVIAPIFGTAAFPHASEKDWLKRILDIDGRATPEYEQVGWPSVATFPGLPATAIPAGRTSEGLPTGVQLIGPYLEDRTTIALAIMLHGLV
jgi:amidase